MTASNLFSNLMAHIGQTLVAHSIGENVIKTFPDFHIFIDATAFQSNLMDLIPTPVPVHCRI